MKNHKKLLKYFYRKLNHATFQPRFDFSHHFLLPKDKKIPSAVKLNLSRNSPKIQWRSANFNPNLSSLGTSWGKVARVSFHATKTSRVTFVLARQTKEGRSEWWGEF